MEVPRYAYSQFIFELYCFDCAISRESMVSLCHKMTAYMNKKFITPVLKATNWIAVKFYSQMPHDNMLMSPKFDSGPLCRFRDIQRER